MEEKIINPFEIMPPENRWRPTKEQQELFGDATEKLMPPLVEKNKTSCLRMEIE